MTGPDLWAHIQPQASRRLLLAALDAFAARGYHATTTREIAERAGMSPAAVYVHYRSKLDLLHEIARTGHQAVLAEVEDARAGASDPPERLRRFVATFAAWHARHHTIARVIQYELEALPDERLAEIAKLRRRFETLMRSDLRDGAAAGAFEVPDPSGTALAILSLCIDVARWYSPRRRETPELIGRRYADLSARMVEAPGRGERRC